MDGHMGIANGIGQNIAMPGKLGSEDRCGQEIAGWLRGSDDSQQSSYRCER